MNDGNDLRSRSAKSEDVQAQGATMDVPPPRVERGEATARGDTELSTNGLLVHCPHCRSAMVVPGGANALVLCHAPNDG